ncbi:pentatricopeptide repeat-containing protein At3g49240, mitochondrial [Diospyros lotus]|uniref:pentatricopeptide repeat-containing protein At3g49240, mitochondrial n=1 Tax=Diospyros lotus TaxID=55363 RepID=UPI00225A5B9D|nr:pentatricopeptide repeat-containing protein At3g49240, mitochondrial [Diospyros lotus]
MILVSKQGLPKSFKPFQNPITQPLPLVSLHSAAAAMALSKPSFFAHLKTVIKPYRRSHPPLPFVSLRFLSFATPEEAAAERRRRKRRLRIEPPLNSLRQSQPPPQQQQQPPRAPPNPNAPKVPETVSVLTGNRLNLHNRILTLIRENDLEEAALLTRHSIYSNCRPTIFTCNAVMAALLRQSRYAELLSLHRFITQAGVAANVVTHNLLINAYMDCRKTDTALEHYKQLINDAPFNPSPTTYRILIKGLVDNNKVERALELKDEMLSKGFEADPIVYHYLMRGEVKNSNPDGVFSLYNELEEKLGGFVSDGVVYGDLMKGYFLRGMEEEAMECYEKTVGENSKIKMSAVAYNSVLEALCKNGKFDEALQLFDRMLSEHNPPGKLTVNLGSYNVMVDGYCAQGRFKDAIEVFNTMGEKRCRPDTLSYNNLIEQLCGNGMLGEAEELYRGMGEKGVNPDEFTFVLLMDTCFKENRPDAAAGYFRTMVDSKLRPNLGVYNKLVEGLVKVGKVDEAKSFYDLMVGKLKMDDASYTFVMKALFDIGKADEVLKMVGGLLRDEGLEFSAELQEFVRGELSKEGREEDLVKLMEEVKREKAEAAAKEAEEAEKAKASSRAAISSLIPSKLFGNKEGEEKSTDATGNAAETASTNIEVETGKEENVADAVAEEQAIKGENLGEQDKIDVTSTQVTA